jgi:hypothetical protein
LRRLEQRLDQASEAAERLMAQAAAAAAARVASSAGESVAGAGESVAGAGESGAGAGESLGTGNPGGGPGEPGPRAGESAGGAGESAGGAPPPSGWQTTDGGTRGSTSELDPLVALVQAVRDLIPPDLQQRLIAAFREVLLALRALIDWYLDRLDRRREQGVEVQDIPIL